MGTKDKLAETAFDSLPAMMEAYAVEAIRVAWSDHGQRFDLSEASIALLETVLSRQAAVDLEFQSRLWGSYLGEVLRKRYGGEWELAQYPGWTAAAPALKIHGSYLYPLMKVYRRLTLGDTENLPAFCEMVATRLDGSPNRQPAET